MGQWEFIHKAPLNQLEFELNHSNVPNLVLLARVVVTLAVAILYILYYFLVSELCWLWFFNDIGAVVAVKVPELRWLHCFILLLGPDVHCKCTVALMLLVSEYQWQSNSIFCYMFLLVPDLLLF